MGVLLGDAGSGYYGTDARVPDVAQRVTHTIEDRNVDGTNDPRLRFDEVIE
jgi:hypothetical protein